MVRDSTLSGTPIPKLGLSAHPLSYLRFNCKNKLLSNLIAVVLELRTVGHKVFSKAFPAAGPPDTVINT